MSNNQNKRKKEPFREWLSDNLRYILLILGVLAALVLLFFGVRAISKRLGGTAGGAGTTGNSAQSTISGQEDGASSAGNEAEGTVSGAEGQTGEAKDLTPSTETEINQLIEQYYDAYSKQDLARLEELTDTLPESQAAAISSSQTTFSDVTVYTKEGIDEDSRIVYAYYHQYTADNQEDKIPGLSRMYVRKGDDGSWKIVFSELDTETSTYITSVTEGDDIQELIAKVRTEYEKTAAADSQAGAAANEQGATADSGQAGTAADGQTGNAAEDSAGTAAGVTDNAAAAPEEVSLTPSPEEGTETADVEEAEEEELNDGETQESSKADYSDEEQWTATIAASCNVRSGPGYDFAVISGVPEGEEVTIIGAIDNGWYHIVTDDVDGYVGGRFIED